MLTRHSSQPCDAGLLIGRAGVLSHRDSLLSGMYSAPRRPPLASIFTASCSTIFVSIIEHDSLKCQAAKALYSSSHRDDIGLNRQWPPSESLAVCGVAFCKLRFFSTYSILFGMSQRHTALTKIHTRLNRRESGCSNASFSILSRLCVLQEGMATVSRQRA